jgi:DNA invertase Pin-like site-specific DNA recombinase
MSVYVDDAVVHWRGRRWAHLMADTLDELHAFAARLGIPRRAFQDKSSGAHYDVTAELRDEAIRLGAVAISRHRDRARMRAVIAQARAQGRGESS